MTALAQQLRDVSARLGRLSPSHRDPEAFFVERDELRETLECLARDAAREERPR